MLFAIEAGDLLDSVKQKEEFYYDYERLETSGTFSQQEYYSEPQVSKYCPARMRRSCTPTAPQLFCAPKECVMKTATTIQENAEDIYAEAQQINEDRAAQAAKEYDGEAEAAETATEE